MHPKETIAKPIWQTAAQAFGLTMLLLLAFIGFFYLIKGQGTNYKPTSHHSQQAYTYPEDYSAPISSYYTYLLDPAGSMTIDSAIQHNEAGHFTTWYKGNTPFSLGMDNMDTWFYLPVENKSPKDICLVWHLSNTLDTAQLFCKDGSEIHAHRPVSFFTALSARALPVRALFDTLWIGAGERRELYLHLWRNHYNLYVPMSLQPLHALQRSETRLSNIYSAYIAIFVFIILFNFFLYYSLRDPIHLWYPFFIFCICMILLLDAFYDLFLFPDFIYRICAITETVPFVDWSVVGSGMVMQLLLKQSKGNSVLWLPMRIVLAIDILWGALQLLLCALSIKGILIYPFYFLHKVSDILVLTSALVLMTSVIEKIIQGERLARIYLFTSMLPTLGLLNFYLNSIGFTSIHFLYPNSVAAGVMLEIICLTLLLTQRYNQLQRDKNQLLESQLSMQRELGDRIAETQENEQKRIAADLHDGIGSLLTAIRMMINKSIHHFSGQGHGEAAETLTVLQGQVDKAVSDIRDISHNLMPKAFDEDTFNDIIKNHLNTIKAGTQINVEYYLDPRVEHLSKGLQINLFRMFAELLNNALKHSLTEHVTIQFIVHQHMLQLQVEDEGRGFNAELTNQGIGLKNLRSRVGYLGGDIRFDSSSKGTIVIIEIPI